MSRPAGGARGAVTRRSGLGVCVAWLFLAGPLIAETLKIATYNVENYVAANRMVEGVYRKGYPKPEEAKAALRAVIRALDADVIALQEIGPEPYLEELRRDLKSEGVDYPYSAWLDAADADRHVAVLARRPFKTVTKHRKLLFSYFGAEEPVKRGLLEVRFDTEAGEFAVFVVHLKSRFTDRADDPQSALRRAGEATAVRDRVIEIFPEPGRARFLIVGDCNDTPASRPLRALQARGKTTIATIVEASDSRGETWTHFYRKEDSYSRVDFVLASPGLAGAIRGGKATIFDGAEAKNASDHRPVSVIVELPAGGL